MIRALRPSLLVLLALGAACAAPSAGGAGGTAPAAAASHAGAPRLYVPNQDEATVSIIEPLAGAVVATVNLQDFGFTANAKPHAVVAEPDGSAWYVTLIGDGAVAKFSRDNRLLGQARMETPGMLALDPRHDRLYASRSMTAVSPPSSVGIIRRSTMALVDELDVLLPRPHGIAVDSLSGRLYVSGLGDNRLAVVDTAGRVELADVAGPLHAYVTLELAPDGRRLAASTQLTARLLDFDVTGPLPVLRHAVAVLPFGYQLAWSPDGQSVWLGNQRSGAVTRVDAVTWNVAAELKDSAFAEPHGVRVSRDGRTVYVSSHGRQLEARAPTAVDTMHHGMHAGEGATRAGGTLVLIDARTGALRQVIPVGRFPTALGLGGAGRP